MARRTKPAGALDTPHDTDQTQAKENPPMFQEFVASLFAFFVLDPFEAEMNRRLANANAPMEVVESARDCIADAGPAILNRVGDDYWWGIANATYVVVGMSRAEDVLVEVAPSCAPALTSLGRMEAEGEN